MSLFRPFTPRRSEISELAYQVWELNASARGWFLLDFILPPPWNVRIALPGIRTGHNESR